MLYITYYNFPFLRLQFEVFLFDLYMYDILEDICSGSQFHSCVAWMCNHLSTTNNNRPSNDLVFRLDFSWNPSTILTNTNKWTQNMKNMKKETCWNGICIVLISIIIGLEKFNEIVFTFLHMNKWKQLSTWLFSNLHFCIGKLSTSSSFLWSHLITNLLKIIQLAYFHFRDYKISVISHLSFNACTWIHKKYW